MMDRKDIELLKHQWMSDPMWDIEYTEGFEEHEAELLQFRLQKEAEWKNARIEKTRALADKMICSFDTARYIEELEDRIKKLEAQIETVANVALKLDPTNRRVRRVAMGFSPDS